MDRIVGIGEYAISNNKNDIIKTFALSSCVAVTAYSSLKSAAGMAHIALPSASNPKERNTLEPCYYADIGIPLLINKMRSVFGCLAGEIEVKIFGGANSIRKDDIFSIGHRNICAVKTTLDALNIKYHEAQVGGMHSRTIFMEVVSGNIMVMAHPLII